MKTVPFKHQAKAYARSRDEEAWALLFEPGLGKSKTLIDTTCHLFTQGKIKAVLVLAPKGVYNIWVDEQLPAHMWDEVPYEVVKWEGQRSIEAMTKVLADFESVPADTLRVLVMNIEALSGGKTEATAGRGYRAARDFLKKYPAMAVVDESTTIKSVTSSRTKWAIALGQHAHYRRILTGTPITQSPLDLFGQCEFLRRGLLGTTSFYAFRGMYAEVITQYLGAKSFKKVVGYRNLEGLQRKLEAFSSRATKAEALDLPMKIYQRREVELTPEQRRAYEQMRKHAVTQLSGGAVMSAPLALTVLLRLQQIVCGIATRDDGGVEAIPSRRVDELMAVLAEVPGKCIIWANYLANISDINLRLEKEYGTGNTAVYTGDTDRVDAVARFRSDPACRFFLATTRSGGYGLTLTEADTVVYFSNGFSLEARLQSEDRAHRVGQTKAITYIDLFAPKTVDEKIVKALRAKKALSAQVLGEELGEWLDV